MNLVIFGLTVSSSWGNGHATLWRALIKALARRGHTVTFYERDVPYYAQHRDLTDLPAGASLVLYGDWDDARAQARRDADTADVVMVTSYCPDGIAASELALDSRACLKTFYDLDTPVTLSRLEAGEYVDYLPERGLQDFDLVLSYTGGAALTALRERLGAKRAVPIYGSVDPDVHCPAQPVDAFRADLSYLGTYAEDRQEALVSLFLEPARRLPLLRFLIGGAKYPQDFPWSDNVYFVQHLPPADHPAFYCSSRLTLNITRRAMAQMGYCPSGRLFEAAACGVPILSDDWEGLEQFFTPGEEILIARTTEEAVTAIEMPDEELQRIAGRARERVLAKHTATQRAIDLENALASPHLALHATFPQRGGKGGMLEGVLQEWDENRYVDEGIVPSNFSFPTGGKVSGEA